MKRGQRLKVNVIILLIIIPVFLSGCWDSKELNKRLIVTGLGFDIDPDTGNIMMIYQSLIPSAIKSSSDTSGVGQQKRGNSLHTVQLSQSTGSSPFDALNHYVQQGSRTPFYQHTQVYIFGKAVVQKGIFPLYDAIIRYQVNRPDVLIVIAEKGVSDILEAQDGIENIQAFGMINEIKLSAEFSRYPKVTNLEFANRLMSKTTAPIAPIIGIYEETGPDGVKTQKNHIVGTAVLKGDKMIGQLNARESSGLLWGINKVDKGYVVIPEASFEIIHAKSKIVAELKDNKIKITIEIDERSNLTEYKGSEDLTPEILKKLEKNQAKEIKSQVMAAVEKSLSLNADIMGFGDSVHRKYKNEWKALEPIWDEIYPDIEVVVKVSIKINEIGDINKALMKK